ncbi:hypothetical protein LENED_004705 [Lentinula edodes]|uniref:Uncharacterized protein n=1 Tax=Lentinula edodes TaxID=5353 RepID=A0A1Q3E6Z1_LENED|nr:hypothetical protein LENED_004705 [Lentinula edodes]
MSTVSLATNPWTCVTRTQMDELDYAEQLLVSSLLLSCVVNSFLHKLCPLNSRWPIEVLMLIGTSRARIEGWIKTEGVYSVTALFAAYHDC